MKNYYTTIPLIETWADVQKVYEDRFWNKPHVFRGQGDAGWDLTTSIERTHLLFNDDLKDLAATEQGFLRLFQRRYHHYVQDSPRDDDLPEWLAVMQHYGAPTRLLDVTHSFYVALFFAIEVPAKAPSALWAFDVQKMSLRAKQMYGEIRRIFDKTVPRDQNLRERAHFNNVFGRNRSMVHPLSPFRLNERLTIQQGWFLVPGNLGKSFVQNLEAMGDAQEFVTKVEISPTREARMEMLHRLHRMNMTRGTLFPGLAGFAESLRTVLCVPNVIAGVPADQRSR